MLDDQSSLSRLTPVAVVPLNRASPTRTGQLLSAERLCLQPCQCPRQMDDTLEQPKHSPNLDAISGERVEDREQDAFDDDDEDDDGGLDWTKLSSVPSLLRVHSV